MKSLKTSRPLALAVANLPIGRMNIMNINLAQETDLNAIQKVVETAFSDEEDKIIRNLACDLLTETARPSI